MYSYPHDSVLSYLPSLFHCPDSPCELLHLKQASTFQLLLQRDHCGKDRQSNVFFGTGSSLRHARTLACMIYGSRHGRTISRYIYNIIHNYWMWSQLLINDPQLVGSHYLPADCFFSKFLSRALVLLSLLQ